MLTPSYAALPDRVGGGARPRPRRLERRARARGRRARRRRAGVPREARSGLGRAGSPRRWGSATSASRSGASARSRTACTSGARGFVHAELIDPETGAAVALDDGATGELVLTHLRHRAAPLLRFRTRDHVEVRTSPCACGRTGPRVRCIGRTDDMLIVRGVNVFPSAVREVVSGVRAARSAATSSSCRGRRASSRSRRCPSASSWRAAPRPTPRSPRRSVRDCATCSSSRPTSSSCRGGACGAASTSRSSSSR